MCNITSWRFHVTVVAVETTMHSVCDELHVSVIYTKVLSVAQQSFYGK